MILLECRKERGIAAPPVFYMGENRTCSRKLTPQIPENLKPQSPEVQDLQPGKHSKQAASRSVSLLLLLALCHLILIFLLSCGPYCISKAETLKTKVASITITMPSLQQLSWSASPDATQASGAHFILMGAVLVSGCPLCYPMAPFFPPKASGHVLSLPFIHASSALKPFLVSFSGSLGGKGWKLFLGSTD